MPPLSAGEGPFAIPEELAFHQGLGNRSAVDRHERRVAARAFKMHQARRQFLAAARLAADVDGGLAARELVYHLARLLHERRVAEQHRERSRVGIFFAALFWLVCARQHQGRTHERTQLVERNRLRQVIEGARLQRGNRIFGAAMRSDHGHRRARIVETDVLQQLQAVAVRQAHVGQAQIVAVLLHQLRGLELARRAIGIQPHALQRETQQLADISFVVNDQNPALVH